MINVTFNFLPGVTMCIIIMIMNGFLNGKQHRWQHNEDWINEKTKDKPEKGWMADQIKQCVTVVLQRRSLFKHNSTMRHTPHSHCPFSVGIKHQLSASPSVVSRVVAEESRCLCELKSQRSGSGVCWSGGVHSLTANQILHSSKKEKWPTFQLTIQSYRIRQQ